MPPRHVQLAPPKPPPSAAPAAQPSNTRAQTAEVVNSVALELASTAQPTTTTTAAMTPFTSSAASASSSSSPFPSAPPTPASFSRRKATILAQLALPDDEYTDLSPKGTVDAGIRDLIDEINAVDGLVTTSSCAGRVSVFLEGRRGGGGDGEGGGPGHDFDFGRGGLGPSAAAAAAAGKVGAVEGQLQLLGHPQADVEDVIDGEVAGDVRAATSTTTTTIAGVGGKGGGGKWLFVSHDPVQMEGKLDSEPNIVAALLGMEEPIFDGRDGSQAEGMSDGGTRLIHFKFEPMILHILTASPYHAQVVLRCGLQAGFRESGAINLIPPVTSPSSPGSSITATATPIVAIRSMGLGLESLIGRETNGIKHCTVSGEYLKALIRIANERFVDNARRIVRFRTYLREALSSPSRDGAAKKKGDGEGGIWEDAETRKERKRAEGLKRADEVRKMREELEQQQREREREQDQQQQQEQI